MWVAALLLVTLLGTGLVFLSPDRYAGKLAAAVSAVPALRTDNLWSDTRLVRPKISPSVSEQRHRHPEQAKRRRGIFPMKARSGRGERGR